MVTYVFRAGAWLTMSVLLLVGLLLVEGSEAYISATPRLSDTTVKVVNRNMGVTQEVPLVSISVVRGNTIEMECDITSGSQDRVKLVLFFRNDSLIPIYSYDMRTKSGPAMHWHDNNLLQERAEFQVRTSPARLVISNARDQDEGLYKCRVDFEKVPTRISEIQLSVIVPPEKPTIKDMSRGEVVRSRLGPYREGDNMTLECSTRGGNPSPSLVWNKDHQLLDNTWKRISNEKVVNRLDLKNIGRRDLHSLLTCVADNNNVSVSVSTSVKVDLLLAPLSVRILDTERPLSAEKQHTAQCQIVGARPRPRVTWWLGTRKINSTEQIDGDGNLTVSSVSLMPRVEDNGSVLSCQAQTPGIAITMEDTWVLPVHYIPKTSLRLGSSLNGSNIKEGDDVYFECQVFANPPPYKITWKNNGVVIKPRKGILIRDGDLVLQGVERVSQGKYTCSAHNREGDGHSNAVLLDVKYPPFCVPNQIRVYGVARHESVNVSCSIRANPDSNLHFHWIFNSTAEKIDIQESSIDGSNGWSSVLYTPRSEMDYGSLLCWAENNIGRQEEPCVFHIVPAGPPDRLKDCIIRNVTYFTAEISCRSGFDGGLVQQFNSVVQEAVTKSIVSNERSKTPLFRLSDLSPGTHYNVIIFAVNAKGQSESVSVPLMSLKEPEKQIAETRTKEGGVGGVLAVVGGVVGGVILVITIVCLVAYSRCRTNHRRREEVLLEGRGPDIVISSTEQTGKASSTSYPSNASERKKLYQCSEQAPGVNVKFNTGDQSSIDAYKDNCDRENGYNNKLDDVRYNNKSELDLVDLHNNECDTNYVERYNKVSSFATLRPRNKIPTGLTTISSNVHSQVAPPLDGSCLVTSCSPSQSCRVSSSRVTFSTDLDPSSRLSFSTDPLYSPSGTPGARVTFSPDIYSTEACGCNGRDSLRRTSGSQQGSAKAMSRESII